MSCWRRRWRWSSTRSKLSTSPTDIEPSVASANDARPSPPDSPSRLRTGIGWTLQTHGAYQAASFAAAVEPMRTTDWLLLVLLSVLWGATFFFVAVALQDLPPLTLVLARVALAALILAPIAHMLALAWPAGL